MKCKSLFSFYANSYQMYSKRKVMSCENFNRYVKHYEYFSILRCGGSFQFSRCRSVKLAFRKVLHPCT